MSKGRGAGGQEYSRAPFSSKTSKPLPARPSFRTTQRTLVVTPLLLRALSTLLQHPHRCELWPDWQHGRGVGGAGAHAPVRPAGSAHPRPREQRTPPRRPTDRWVRLRGVDGGLLRCSHFAFSQAGCAEVYAQTCAWCRLLPEPSPLAAPRAPSPPAPPAARTSPSAPLCCSSRAPWPRWTWCM